MPSQPRPACFTFTTTDGHQATLYVVPDGNPWQAATQHARAAFASDSQLAELRIASEAEIAALNAQLENAPLAPVPPSEPGSGATPPPARPAPSPAPSQPARGAKVNVGWQGRGPTNHPAWASRFGQETWRTAALVIWDHDLHRIVGLSAEQAVDLLAHLQSCDQSPQEGLVVGTRMTRIVLNQPDRPPEAMLVDQIELSPAETAALLELLRSHEEALQAQAKAEEVDKRRRLGQVYTLLLNAAAKRRAQQAPGDTNPDLPEDQPAQPDAS